LGDGAKGDIVVSADLLADDGSARFEPVDFEGGSTGGNEEFTDRGFEAGNVAVQAKPHDQWAREADEVSEQFTRPARAEASECRDDGGFGGARKRFTIGRAQPWSPKGAVRNNEHCAGQHGAEQSEADGTGCNGRHRAGGRHRGDHHEEMGWHGEDSAVDVDGAGGHAVSFERVADGVGDGCAHANQRATTVRGEPSFGRANATAEQVGQTAGCGSPVGPGRGATDEDQRVACVTGTTAFRA
jgi:hypothetical protein